jgi:hypothetical protein
MSQLPRVHHNFDVCIIGGGMAGLIAAMASARHGAKTCLIHDRPVLGGNASSEVRMWICGPQKKNLKETGILEEIQLENYYRNPSLNYSIWDSVLYGKAFFEPNLTTFLNTTCNGAEMDGENIASITCWTLTSQTWQVISAKQFIDCSGDGILGGVTPAQWRAGRESKDEFNESIQPSQADDKTMGNSLLIQIRKTDSPQPYIPPSWAYKITNPDDIPYRMSGLNSGNWWWIELGGLQDTLADAEVIRDDLMRTVYGVWDYVKNYHPQKQDVANWAIEWIGSLPGKRENRRFIGDYILTQNDIREQRQFDDIIAYGGWPMDDHHPAGLLYPGKPTIFHGAPAPYAIPFRCLYSKNVPNLLFAGRNISVTHAALSSTRVMGTTSLLGQAVGTAAAIAIKHNVTARDIANGPLLKDLQFALMDDDSWLPGLKRPACKIAKDATLTGDGQNLPILLDGTDRDTPDEDLAWEGKIGDSITFSWDAPVDVRGLRATFDSNLANMKRQPCSYPQKGDRCLVPDSMVKEFRVEAQLESGQWTVVHHETLNYMRLFRVAFNVKAKAIRVTILATWGAEKVRIFALEPLDRTPHVQAVEDGPKWTDIRARLKPEDLAEPENGMEHEPRVSMHSA